VFSQEDSGKTILLNSEENALDVQIHDFIPPILLIDLVEFRSPSCTRIGKQNIDMIGVLFYFFDQALNLRDLGTICWDGVRFGAGLFVLECIQRGNSLVAGAGFARRDEDFGAPCL
jgi:hypothetical protein